ncbi:MAG: hypothetical protein H0T46_05080 [Deltaproteobacteria bacterium]|nr:hypothetical protein [Deltaproteobacteria bacterium]
MKTTPIPEFKRRYECRCIAHVENASTSLAGNPGAYPGHEFANPGWACAGHPALAVPSELDGVQISAERFRDIARVGFASPPFVPPESEGLAIWVSRLYWILPESFRPALGDAVADLLLDPDARVAVRAMRFYREQRMAMGQERLTEIARDHGARLATITDPDDPRYTLEYQLLSALVLRGFRHDDAGGLIDPEAHELLRQAVLAGKNPDDVIYTFARLELEWLVANAVEIVKNGPERVTEIVYLLRRLPMDQRLVVYRAVADLSPDIRAALLKNIDADFKDEERTQILAHLEGGN